MIDDFVSEASCEEFYNYAYEYEMSEIWYEVESSFCQEEGYEAEVYED